MKYHGNTDFLSENLHLRRTPQNSTGAYNKLVCLMQLEKCFVHNDDKFFDKPLSKRRERLTRMYWAYRRMGVIA